MSNPKLKLKGYSFEDLFQTQKLNQLDQTFLNQLKKYTPQVYEDLLAYRHETRTFTAIEISELLLACAPILEKFLIELFDIETAATAAQIKTVENNPISVFKKFFVLRQAKKQLHKSDPLPSFAELNTWLGNELKKSPLKAQDEELNIALLGCHYLEDTEKYVTEIEKLTQWCIQAIKEKQHTDWVSFRIPERVDYDKLVKCENSHDKLNRLTVNEEQLYLRDGFKLTDPRMNARQVQDEVNYCIYCHDHDGDFCSKGFPAKKGVPDLGLKKNPLDVTLTGCPLEEKISEMDLLKRDGYTLASLAMVMVDNPMCPATGHRICNDCMKACIYQKQDPVNVPQIETRVLTDVLDLPWGVEIVLCF